ncbi:MAG: hypothetical protein CMG64_00570 [Candidatus Marinimicrobia bacterium]|nr:hypothetical protein [Candidatus Neomarinimicrobiota bacterium]
MSIRSYKTQILLFYIAFMLLNSVMPIISSKGIWKYDKLIHFVEFFILGVLFINAIIDTELDIYKFLFGIFVLTLIPIADEGVQYLFEIPGRVADFNDLVVDILGEYCGSLAFVFYHKMVHKNG